MKQLAAYSCLFIMLVLAACGKNKASCSDHIKNQDELATDCGGSCSACPTCKDGVMNGHEQDVDCGGPECKQCGSNEDGFMNRDESGVDCGGADCVPCEATGCNVPPGKAKSGYLSNSMDTLVSVAASNDEAAKDGQVKFNAGADFKAGSNFRGFTAQFYGSTILNLLSTNKVQVFKTILQADLDNSSNKPVSFFNNKCVILMNMSILSMSVRSGEAVYITKTGVDTYNLKFCLPAPQEGPYTLDTDFSANLDFTIKK